MKPTLITGATGFIGWHVARHLVEQGVNVRVLARDPKRVHDLDGVEIALGDLKDPDSLRRAVAGCGVVYHVAADYRLWSKDPEELYRCNVAGTHNLLAASREAGIDRFVYTSTEAASGCHPAVLAMKPLRWVWTTWPAPTSGRNS